MPAKKESDPSPSIKAAFDKLATAAVALNSESDRLSKVVSDLASWTSRASVFAALVAAVVLVARARAGRLRLEDLLSRSLAAGALPTGLVLIYCGFDPTLMGSLTGLNLHIAAAGLSLLYLS